MNNLNDPQSRRDRHKKQRENRVLNVLIAVVVIAIVLVAFIVIPGGKEQSENIDEKNQHEEIIQEDKKEQEDQEQVHQEEQENEQNEEPEIDATEEEDSKPIITEETGDPVVVQSIVDPSWAPIQTAQVGEHVSMYDGVSVDWQEKVSALTYATGLPEEGMTIWRLKNGGSPKKSIGIVSSKDTIEKYRVYLEWIDTEGWKPVKMDVLNTLDFNY